MEIRKLTANDYDQMAALWTKAELAFKPKGRDSKQVIAEKWPQTPISSSEPSKATVSSV